jgi:lipopolysaccharide/colanic/teichoic acid biosynthesis glycosyltransferase
VTERQEGVDAGVARLVGTSRARIASETLRLLRDRGAHGAMARAVNPYGDGRAAERIASALREGAAAGGGPAVHLSGSSLIPAANPAASGWGEGQQRTDGEAPGRLGVQRYRRLYGAKRAVDILVSLALIVIGLPVFALGALLIRFESPGHVIYWRLRCGRNGKVFRCYKIRSMYEDADVRFATILTASSPLREEYGRYHKFHRDPRITRVGRILRRFSLDELPQLWNVFVGDMSLVGPRPYDMTELAAMRSGDRVILTVRPGLTGLWQISGRNTMSFAHRLDLDRKYVREWSPWLELKIVVRTLPTVLSGRGAF